MTTHSSILAWRIPQTEEPDGLWSIGSQRVGHSWVNKHSTQGFSGGTSGREPTCQASLSVGSSRQEYWSGLSCSPAGDLPNPGIEPRSPALGEISTVWATREGHLDVYLWPIHLDVWQKPSQYCKVIILQLNKYFKNKWYKSLVSSCLKQAFISF